MYFAQNGAEVNSQNVAQFIGQTIYDGTGSAYVVRPDLQLEVIHRNEVQQHTAPAVDYNMYGQQHVAPSLDMGMGFENTVATQQAPVQSSVQSNDHVYEKAIAEYQTEIYKLKADLETAQKAKGLDINLSENGMLNDENISGYSLQETEKVVTDLSYYHLLKTLGTEFEDDTFYKFEKESSLVLKSLTGDENTVKGFINVLSKKLRSFSIYDYADFDNVITMKEAYKLDTILLAIFQDTMLPLVRFNYDSFYLSLVDIKKWLQKVSVEQPDKYKEVAEYLGRVKSRFSTIKMSLFKLDEENFVKVTFKTDLTVVKSDDLYNIVKQFKLSDKPITLLKDSYPNLYNSIKIATKSNNVNLLVLNAGTESRYINVTANSGKLIVKNATY